ncbi:MAG: GNAT family N-acetyltransferase [Thermoplasmatales archaeon]|nr:GNAT family N-acetyltransferase [Thermoplasmatales archaeon]
MAYVRYFAASDLGEVMRIFLAGLDEAIPPSDLLSFSALWPNGQIVACDPTGSVVGAVFGTVHGNKSRVMAIAVDGNRRGGGIATRLLLRFMAESVARGAGTVTLELRPANQAAHAFYKKMGFVETAYLENHYSDGGPCIVMSAPAARLS